VTPDSPTDSRPPTGSSGASSPSSAASASASGALLLELNHRLPAGHGHRAVDDRALGDRDPARDDVGVEHGGGADLELVLDDELSRGLPREHGSLRVNLPLPLRRRGPGARAGARPAAPN